MDRGVYAAASGGLSSLRLLQVVSNNLANSSTVGFKAERVVSREQAFADTLAGAIGQQPARAQADHERTPGVVDISTTIDFTPGPISPTGNPLDAALVKENQFFVVQTPQGEQYTRAGNFRLDASGQLVTPDGMPVLGDAGPITIQGRGNITNNGTILVGKEKAGRLRIVEVEDLKQLERQGNTRFSLKGGQAAPVLNPEVAAEAVEMPNVTVVQSMVDMINANRAFESYTKSVRTISELDEISIRNARSVG